MQFIVVEINQQYVKIQQFPGWKQWLIQIKKDKILTRHFFKPFLDITQMCYISAAPLGLVQIAFN